MTRALAGRFGWKLSLLLFLLLYNWDIYYRLKSLLPESQTPWGWPETILYLLPTATFLLLPFVVAGFAWWQTRVLVREDTISQLLLTPVRRRAILAAGLRQADLLRAVILLLVLPLLLTVPHQLSRCPLILLVFIAPDTWNAEVIDSDIFEWWFTVRHGDETGWVLVCAVTLLWLHSSMRFATAASASCAVRGRGSNRSLAFSLLGALAPIAAGLVLAHLVQKFVILPNDYYRNSFNWFGRWVSGRGEIPFNYALAAMCCIVALPTVLAAFLSRVLWRSAARRLDRLVTD